jgi:hypothetical protein
VAAINNGRATVDRARFDVCERQATRGACESIPRFPLSYPRSMEYKSASFPSPRAAPISIIRPNNPHQPFEHSAITSCRRQLSTDISQYSLDQLVPTFVRLSW